MGRLDHEKIKTVWYQLEKARSTQNKEKIFKLTDREIQAIEQKYADVFI